jgi:hypothetical protein
MLLHLPQTLQLCRCVCPLGEVLPLERNEELISSFGGVKGVSKAHDLLLKIINQHIKIIDEAKTLQVYLDNP